MNEIQGGFFYAPRGFRRDFSAGRLSEKATWGGLISEKGGFVSKNLL